MAINPTQANMPPATSGVIPPNPKGEMGPETFMKLLVAELKQQDPNEPMQAREMVAQLASLTSVQKLSAIETKLSALEDGSIASASLQSATLIGKTVSAKTNRLPLDSVSQPSGSYKLTSDAAAVSVKVLNSQGQVVRTLDLGSQKGGPRSFQWDGKTQDGVRADKGAYSFQVVAADAKGIPVPASTEVSGLVTEVTYEHGAPEVVVGGAHVQLADVTSIAQ